MPLLAQQYFTGGYQLIGLPGGGAVGRNHEADCHKKKPRDCVSLPHGSLPSRSNSEILQICQRKACIARGSLRYRCVAARRLGRGPRRRQLVLGRTAASTRPAAHVSLTDANGIGLSRAVQACLNGMADVIRCRGDSGVHFAGSQGKSCKKYGKQKKILGRGFALRLMEKLRYRCSHTFHNNLPPAQLAALSVTLKYLRHRTMRSKSESLNTQTKLPRTPAIGHKQYYHG